MLSVNAVWPCSDDMTDALKFSTRDHTDLTVIVVAFCDRLDELWESLLAQLAPQG